MIYINFTPRWKGKRIFWLPYLHFEYKTERRLFGSKYRELHSEILFYWFHFEIDKMWTSFVEDKIFWDARFKELTNIHKKPSKNVQKVINEYINIPYNQRDNITNKEFQEKYKKAIGK